MKKKLLVLPLIVVCLITGIFIGSCGRSSATVGANNNNFNQIDNLGNHIFYVWTDTNTNKEYIIYHNTFYNEFSICPR